MLVMISSMSVFICNRFYARQANSGKITYFKGGPVYGAVVRDEALNTAAQNFATKN